MTRSSSINYSVCPFGSHVVCYKAVGDNAVALYVIAETTGYHQRNCRCPICRCQYYRLPLATMPLPSLSLPRLPFTVAVSVCFPMSSAITFLNSRGMGSYRLPVQYTHLSRPVWLPAWAFLMQIGSSIYTFDPLPKTVQISKI